MSISSNVLARVSEHLSEQITSNASVGGGCIADSKIITTESGNKYFLKTYAGIPGMFPKEANGLKELGKSKTIKVPNVILADEDFLLLEYLAPGNKGKDFFTDFGRSFAQMHRFTSEHFGFYEDNYIGSNPQLNKVSGYEGDNWTSFYFKMRISVQLQFAKQNGYATQELSTLVSKLETLIHEILASSEEPPTLLHGDLWGGNYMCDSEGRAVLIDPAVYYGHREADLAMTKMFGGFTSAFYKAYQAEYPLSTGWEEREGLYLLYHYMNHLNLFGNSYYGECIRLLRKYV